MAKYIISITAQDRPGIVAGVSEAVLELKGNIEAASQTVHQGYFTMIILCSFAGDAASEKITKRVQARAGEDLHVYVTEYMPTKAEANRSAQTFIVTVMGPDRPGMLRTLTSYLASKKINIDDLYACIKEGDFVVICQVSVPGDLDISMLQTDLASFGESGGFTAHLQHENIFVATNELCLGRIR
jgi:glycine cleavage system transcriptional repressor